MNKALLENCLYTEFFPVGIFPYLRIPYGIWLNTVIYKVNLDCMLLSCHVKVNLVIQFKSGKIWTRKNSVFAHFSQSKKTVHQKVQIVLYAIPNSRLIILIQLIFWIYIVTFKCSLEKGCFFDRKHLNKVKVYKIFWIIHVTIYLKEARGSWWFSSK